MYSLETIANAPKLTPHEIECFRLTDFKTKHARLLREYGVAHKAWAELTVDSDLSDLSDHIGVHVMQDKEKHFKEPWDVKRVSVVFNLLGYANIKAPVARFDSSSGAIGPIPPFSLTESNLVLGCIGELKYAIDSQLLPNLNENYTEIEPILPPITGGGTGA
jgi:hypothetical protein